MGHPLTLTVSRDSLHEYVDVPDLSVEIEPPTGAKLTRALTARPLVIGSAPDADVLVKDPSMSRLHCEISMRPEGVVIRDLKSKNGTSIRGVRVMEAELTPGEPASVGRTSITLVASGKSERVQLSAEMKFGQAVGQTPAMRLMFETLRRAANADVSVMLLGESGTGKEVLARGLHEEGPRKKEPFVVFDCSAVAPTLIESELFGYTKGAFTGADKAREGLLVAANKGTIFLDEVGELPLELQAKLLRALETREVRPVGANEYQRFDARVVCATHRDLRARIAAGSFREDLYFRLAVVVVDIPPLRERKDDIPVLVERFLRGQTPPKSLSDLPPNAMELLKSHHWPGNVRELWNTVTRLVLFPNLGQAAIQSSEAGLKLSAALDAVSHLPLREAREMMVEEFEHAYLVEKLRQHNDNVTQVAATIGVSRQFLYRLLNRYGLRGEGADSGA